MDHQEEVSSPRDDPYPTCEKCDGDGYTESWNDDQSDVVITPCTDCGPAPGEVDG